MRLAFVFAQALVLVSAGAVSAATPKKGDVKTYWPQWRGPNGTGVALKSNPPTELASLGRNRDIADPPFFARIRKSRSTADSPHPPVSAGPYAPRRRRFPSRFLNERAASHAICRKAGQLDLAPRRPCTFIRAVR